MHVVIIEPAWSGHRLTYVRQMLPSILELTDAVTLVTSREAITSDAFKVQISPHADRITIDAEHDALPRTPRKAFASAAMAMLASAAAKHNPGAMFIPSGDAVAQASGLARLRRTRVIPREIYTQAGFHRGAWAYPAGSLARRLDNSINRRLLALCPWDHLLFVDHLVHRDIARRGGSIARRADLLPDPIDPPPDMTRGRAREVLDIDPSARVLGSSGVQDERKGVHHIIGAFARAIDADLLRPTDTLLLAGRMSDPVRAALARHKALTDARRIIALDRYLTDDELASSLIGVDVCAVCHPSHVGLSNIALRAAACGRPVLASDFGWLGEMVPRFGLGVTCNVRDHDALSRAIAQSLDTSDGFTPTPACARLMAFHDQRNFGKVWVRGLRARMGLAPDAGAIPWSTVEQQT